MFPFHLSYGQGNPFTYTPNSSELHKRNPKMDGILEKMCAFTRGLRTPRKEELTGPFSLPGIPDEGEFSEARNLIRNLQRMIAAESLSLAKETTKVSEEHS